jgi:hypothetical protein
MNSIIGTPFSPGTIAEASMGMFDHINIVMIDSIGFCRSKGRRLMKRHKVIDANHKINAAADESKIV